MGLTLDTGALVALERHQRRARSLVTVALERGLAVTVPSVTLVEWWRGGLRRQSARMLEAFLVEPLEDEVALRAGAALGVVAPGPSVTDAVVMASAAQRGDVVLTSDLDDLDALRSVFPEVRLLRV